MTVKCHCSAVITRREISKGPGYHPTPTQSHTLIAYSATSVFDVLFMWAFIFFFSENWKLQILHWRKFVVSQGRVKQDCTAVTTRPQITIGSLLMWYFIFFFLKIENYTSNIKENLRLVKRDRTAVTTRGQIRDRRLAGEEKLDKHPPTKDHTSGPKKTFGKSIIKFDRGVCSSCDLLYKVGIGYLGCQFTQKFLLNNS